VTIAGHAWLTRSLVDLATDLCSGRIVALGGGGYAWEHIVPRMWTLLAGAVAGRELQDELPQSWRDRVLDVAGVEPPERLREDRFGFDEEIERRLLEATRQSVEALMER
jgi:hypothetical protein